MDAISAALGVGGIASNILTNSRNQSNFEKALDFQKWTYNDSKIYNSVPNQIRQLRAAGMNPAFLYGGNAGQSAAMAAPSANPQNPIDLNGLSSIATGINLNDVQASNLNANTAKTKEETEGLSIDNSFKTQNWLSQLYNRDAESWFKDMQSENMKLNNKFLAQTLQDRIWQQKMESQEAQAHAYAQHYLLPYVPLKAQAELDNLAANTKLALDSGIATLKQAFAAIMNAKSTKAAIEAQYGDNTKMRSEFAKATYKFLTQRTSTASSEEYRNVNGIQGVMGTGIKFTYNDHYDSWKKSHNK